MTVNAEEKGKPSAEDRTLKSLSPNVAGLLCYAGIWISGIIFLVLEQKNRFVRFHALQSIIVFGALSVAGGILGRIPFVGIVFSTVIGITAFVLWIVLMIKALNGEYYRIPWAGNLAEKLTSESLASTGTQDRPNTSQETATGALKDETDQSGPAAIAPAAPLTAAQAGGASSVRSGRNDAFRAKYYTIGARTGRAVGSVFAIVWSLALLILLNFFNQYIAYYEPSYSGGTTYWQISSFVTPDFNAWLPLVTTTLILGIIGHSLMIAFDRFILRQVIDLVLDVLTLAAVISLLVIFPFDFSVIPNADAAYWVPVGLTIALILVAVGLGISAIVGFVRLIVNTIEGRY